MWLLVRVDEKGRETPLESLGYAWCEGDEAKAAQVAEAYARERSALADQRIEARAATVDPAR